MLTGKDSADASSVYFRANNGQLIIDTAKAFWAGLLPGASMNINFYPQQDSDPLFSPVATGVAQIDEQMAVATVRGRLGDSAQSLTTAYGPELASRVRFYSTIRPARLRRPLLRQVSSTSRPFRSPSRVPLRR